MIAEGRTHPVVLACRTGETELRSRPMLVKAIGCPEIFSSWQLVTEVVSNAAARRMGVQTPAPAVVSISETVAGQVNQSIKEQGYEFQIQPGFAAGCDFLPSLAPFTVGQVLTPETREQATKMFVFDMLSQNADRRRNKVNCGLSDGGLIAFDFELCFAHRFLKLIGGSDANPWEPSNALIAQTHLFYAEVKTVAPSTASVEALVRRFDSAWWDELVEDLPSEWQESAASIGVDLMAIAEHASEFAKDLTKRCLI